MYYSAVIHPRMNGEILYIIREGVTPYYIIGRANSPETVLQTMQFGNPRTLDLEYRLEISRSDANAIFDRIFGWLAGCGCYVHGSWYKFTRPRLNDFKDAIAEILRG